MDSIPFTIWCNLHFPEQAVGALRTGIGRHRLIVSPVRQSSNLVAGGQDPQLVEADIAFGQPDPRQVVALERLRWIHLTSAGYTRYDTEEVRSALRNRGAVLTNSSMVYAEPCAEHLLAMMLSLARQLPQSWADQATTHAWRAAEHRHNSRLLTGQTVVILGFGAIARRLVELLRPFDMTIIAVRRTVSGDEPVRTVPDSQTLSVLPRADHVVNLLPANASTEGFFNGDMFGAMKPTAVFYNIGRGTTVDAIALRTTLEISRIAGAYLDVTDPEPLPPNSPLWHLPNCWITPHTAGGHADEFNRLVRHFLENLRRFDQGGELLDRVI